MKNEENQKLNIDQETLTRLKSLYVEINKEIKKAVLSVIGILAVINLIAFSLSFFIGGFIGNALAAVLVIGSLSLCYIPLKKLTSDPS